MRHRVFWSPQAERRLEEIALAAPDPKAVAAAARRIDEHLVQQPTTYGESRDENIRIAFCEMLGVQFEVLDDVRTVIVYDVWRIGRRKR